MYSTRFLPEAWIIFQYRKKAYGKPGSLKEKSKLGKVLEYTMSIHFAVPVC